MELVTKSLFKNIIINKLVDKMLYLVLIMDIFGLFGQCFQFQTLDLSQ